MVQIHPRFWYVLLERHGKFWLYASLVSYARASFRVCEKDLPRWKILWTPEEAVSHLLHSLFHSFSVSVKLRKLLLKELVSLQTQKALRREC